MAPAQTSKAPLPRRRSRKLRWLFLAVFALAALVCYPPIFQQTVRWLLKAGAWREGWRIDAGSVEGSFFEPLVFHDLQLSKLTAAGTVTRLGLARVTATFSARNLVFRRGVGFWSELIAEKIEGTIDFPGEAKSPAAPGAAAGEKKGTLIFPSRLVVRDASLLFRQRGDVVRISHATFSASDVESGPLTIRALDVKQPWLSTQFANLTGGVALQGGNVVVSALKLDDRVTVESAAADVLALLNGRLDMKVALDAFNGSIQGEMRSTPGEQHVNLEGSGTFRNISVAQLAAFLNRDADGLITEGRFTFHGAPRDLPRATFSTRFEANDFRWGQRRWNSFTLGATLVNRRLMIPEFRLRQAHNSLSLHGEMAIPADERTWWQDEFNFTIAARIDNLTELSALFGPRLGETSGKLAIDGALRGRNSSFDGELKVTGAELSYGSAPLDKLQAVLAISGNELRITQAELVHGADFVRGHGVVNILGEKRYWGELKASIAELALYSGFMQPPVAPRAFAGGLLVDWSGDGAAQTHSGAFTAQLRKIRPLGDDAALPLNLDADATYSPASIFFSRFVLAESETKLSAQVVAKPSSLDLQNLTLTRGKALWLEGDALLPLNVWSMWQGPADGAWWNYENPCKINLTARNLSLRETIALGGSDRGIRGEIDGTLAAEGTLAALTSKGALQVKKYASSAPAWKIANGEANLQFDGATVAVESSHWLLRDLDFNAQGTITLSDARAPSLAVSLRVGRWKTMLSPELQVESEQQIYLFGPLETAEVSGEVRAVAATLDRALDLPSLVAPGGNGLDAPFSSLALSEFPFPKWRFDLKVTGPTQLKLRDAAIALRPELSLRGGPAALQVTGRIDTGSVALVAGASKLTVDSGAFWFDASSPENPTLVLQAHGVTGGDIFSGAIFGSLTEKQFVWESAALDSASLTALLATGSPSGGFLPSPESPFRLELPEAVSAKPRAFSLRSLPSAAPGEIWPMPAPADEP